MTSRGARPPESVPAEHCSAHHTKYPKKRDKTNFTRVSVSENTTTMVVKEVNLTVRCSTKVRQSSSQMGKLYLSADNSSCYFFFSYKPD